MNKNIFSRTLVAVCAVTFAACDKQQPVAPEPEIILGNQFAAGIPLAVGNRWVYRITNLDPNGAIINTKTHTTEIIREITDGTQQWFVFRTTEGQSSTETYVANIDSAQYYRNPVDSLPLLYLRFPSSSTNSFNMEMRVPGLVGFPDTIVHVPCTISPTSSVVRVPVGQFFAFQYTAAQVNVTLKDGFNVTICSTESYLSDQGLVRSVAYSSFQGKQYVSSILELTDVTTR